jgi:hypothetical protein
MSNAGLPSPAALVPAVDAASARSEANDLVTSALRIGLNLRCGYTALTPDWGAGELITAAQAALAFAQRLGPGAVVG